MHMVPSDPYDGGNRSPVRTKQRYRTALSTTHVAAGSAEAKTGKTELAPERRYHTGELLGRGGMSEVYRGFDAQLHRTVAIKRLRGDFANNPGFRARFRREAQAAGKLNDPAIVAVYDTGEERLNTGPSIPFIVMELVEGRSLRDLLREAGKVPPGQALELTSGVLDALTCSHAAGIIHRDIKPANVMLTSTGLVKVADFGIARPTSDASGTVTLAGTVVGTPQYLSPEQGRGEAVDARSDIYSVGCMLYELLVGEPPFTGDSPVSIVVQHVSDAPRQPSAANAEISPDIDSIVLKALAKNPADRYQTAGEMKADIERVLSGQRPVATELFEAPTISSANSVRSPVVSTDKLKTPHVLVVVAAVLLVVVSGSAFSLYQSSRSATAAASTTEVPAVLGLGRLGAESVLRNANLVPQFEFVNGSEGTVGTVIKQSPNRGDLAAIDSTVVVLVNVGSRPDAMSVADDDTSRSPTRSLHLSASEKFFPHASSGNSYGSQARQSEGSDGPAETHRDSQSSQARQSEGSDGPAETHPDSQSSQAPQLDGSDGPAEIPVDDEGDDEDDEGDDEDSGNGKGNQGGNSQ
jgi:serine/threonine-protein kinase